MGLFRRSRKDGEAVDMGPRSPETGLKHKDIALLGQMLERGANLSMPRHAVYYLYFSDSKAAEAGAVEAGAAGYATAVREPLPQYRDRWSLVCEKEDAVLSIANVREADDLFQGIADRLHGEFDGWEAAV